MAKGSKNSVLRVQAGTSRKNKSTLERPHNDEVVRSKIVETMTRVELRNGAYVVRVWRSEKWGIAAVWGDNISLFVRGQVEKLDSNFSSGLGGIDKFLFADTLLESIPYVSAVEVTDAKGDGCVVYKEWP